jgi:hypothetical protein
VESETTVADAMTTTESTAAVRGIGLTGRPGPAPGSTAGTGGEPPSGGATW